MTKNEHVKNLKKIESKMGLRRERSWKRWNRWAYVQTLGMSKKNTSCSITCFVEHVQIRWMQLIKRNDDRHNGYDRYNQHIRYHRLNRCYFIAIFKSYNVNHKMKSTG